MATLARLVAGDPRHIFTTGYAGDGAMPRRDGGLPGRTDRGCAGLLWLPAPGALSSELTTPGTRT